MATFTGITANNIGSDGYDIAIGYDTGSGIVNMVGYVCALGSEFHEKTNLQDEEHLVQVASAASSDRFGRYPKISQGDWTHGERQLVFTDNQAYYQSDGVDTSIPGELLALGSPQAVSVPSYGNPISHTWPIDTDGKYFYIGWLNASPPADIIVGLGTTQVINGTLDTATNPEIYSLRRTPSGVFAGTSSGIYLVNPVTPSSSVKWTTDVVISSSQYSMAYFSSALYYITQAGAINKTTAAGASPGTSAKAAIAMELPISCLCATSQGLFFATSEQNVASISPSNEAVLYTFDGATATRIAQIPGYVKAAYELNGTTYILACLDQSIGTAHYTLYSLVGSTLSLIDDLRWVSDDFKDLPGLPLNPLFKAGLAGDGKYLYIGIPGLHGYRYDPTLKALYAVCSPGDTTTTLQYQHIVCPTNVAGLVDVYAAPGVFSVTAYNGMPSVGTLTTSYFDASVPGVNKLWQSVEFAMKHPTSPSAITCQYRLDNNTAFNNLTVYASGNTSALVAYFPFGTKAEKVQLKVGFADAQVTPQPIITSYSLKATLGRVWDATLSCRREQQARSDFRDPQNYSGKDLLANIQNARALAGGNVYLYIPDPTASNGVSTVTARIEDYDKLNSGGTSPAMRQTQDAGPDIEADLHLVLVEELGTT